ncbi:MAG: hypothetical protein K8T91_18115 [Planctomycetes bacterium]|nr:hypothetical protein [Planctomycetota bacterium]
MNTTSVPLIQPDSASLILHAGTELRRADAQPGLTAERLRLEGLSQELEEAYLQLVHQRGELAVQAAQLDQQQRRLEHALRHVDQEQTDVDAQRIRLRSQRRRVSDSLKQRKAELLSQLQQFHAALAEANVQPADSTGQVAQLQRERDDLLQRLEGVEAKQLAVEENADPKADDDKTYELRRRFEMAVEDMRAYKHRVEELEEQLAQRPRSVEKAPATGPLNWAQQKANMLASLETDMAGTDQKSIDNRLTVEGAVRITDEVVAAKEQEIQQLRQQLDELRAQRSTASAQDAGIAAVLDHDAVVAAERERLRKLQESVLEKQRTAEVELAVERAKIARQRVEMEDRMHALESDLAHRQGSTVASDNAAPVSRSLRGRWLARLGLKDGDGGA